MSTGIDKKTVCGNGVDLIEECLNMPSGIKVGENDGEAEFSEFGRTLKNTYDEIFSKKSTDSNTKRENANINADTPMGSMLKIGSESVKAYADRYTISKCFANLHKQGYFHIHDKDFLCSGTTTCASADDEVTVMDTNGAIKTVPMSFFDDLFTEDGGTPEWREAKEALQIWGRSGWTPIIKIMRRLFTEKDIMYQISTCDGRELLLTENHRVPVCSPDDSEVEKLVHVNEIRVGDSLLMQLPIDNNDGKHVPTVVTKIDEVPYEGFVYDIETGEHWFSVNGYVVHNCCQIDIDALFERGFSTGHGFLRTPNDVQSYTALTCIAIQSNQNDQHGGQSVPNFDYAIAKGVAKTFIKEYKLAMMGAVEMHSINPELQDYKTIKTAVENLIGIAEGTTKEQASLTMSPIYKSEEHKGIIALGFDSETATKIQDYSYATAERETDKKTYQAMEALIHNLNTMQCLPGSERIWVKQGEDMRLMSMEEINNTFKPGKYEVLSINSNGCAEWKYITASQRKDNNRRLITLTTRGGQRVRVTDNHTVMTTSPSDNHAIVDVMPEDAKWLLSAREVKKVPIKNTICVDDYGTPRVDTPFSDSHVWMSDEFAELLGIYAGDGWIAGGSQLALSVAFKLDRVYLQDLVSRALGIDTTVYESNVLDQYPEYRFNVGTRFCRMMSDICGDKSYNKRVPSQVLLGPDYVKQAFLRGYFSTDGRHTVKYQSGSSVSKELVSGIAYLVQSLGEFPHRSVVHLSHKKERHNDLYNVSLGKRACDRIELEVGSEEETRCEIPRYNLSMVWDEIKKEKNHGGIPRRSRSHAVRQTELDMFMHHFGYKHENIRKYLNFYCVDVISAEETNSGDEYVYDISVEDNENFMTEDCIFVHNSRAGSQVPFSSINYGTDTTAEGRMVMRNLLEATQEGLGRGETPIFPVQVFKVKDGVNYNPGDPNYDLFKLAMETSAKRLFPNFTFLDAPFNLQYYKPGHPETEVATMGCVSGNELIKWHSDTNASARTRTFGETWNIITMDNEIKMWGDSLYVEPDNMFIYDSSVHDFVKVKKVIKNPNQNNWYRVSFDNTLTLVATADHPLPVEGVGRTYVENIKIGDRIPVSDLQNRKLGGDTVKVVNIERINYNAASYDVETETDRFDVSGVCSHNCRTRVMGNFYDPTREIAYGRGNLSFTSMNLPRLAIEVDGNVDAFFERFDKLMDLTIAQLDERVELQMRKHVYNFPMLIGQGVWIDSEKLSPSDELGDILLHGSISVGFIGLAETLRVLTGHHHGESEEAQELGLHIVGYMRSKLDKLAQERRRNYTLLATPAEGLSGRFVNIDRKRFGVIEGVTDREYYTNSFHVPVYYDITAYEKIRIEAPYHALTNAGHISYVELDGVPSRNMESYESIIRCMHDAGIGYGSVNFPLDTDPVCGYCGIIKEGNRCPRCGRDEFEPIDQNGTRVSFTRIRRVTGYLSGDYQTRFNDAKQAEVRDRVKHRVVGVALEETTTPID